MLLTLHERWREIVGQGDTYVVSGGLFDLTGREGSASSDSGRVEEGKGYGRTVKRCHSEMHYAVFITDFFSVLCFSITTCAAFKRVSLVLSSLSISIAMVRFFMYGY